MAVNAQRRARSGVGVGVGQQRPPGRLQLMRVAALDAVARRTAGLVADIQQPACHLWRAVRCSGGRREPWEDVQLVPVHADACYSDEDVPLVVFNDGEGIEELIRVLGEPYTGKSLRSVPRGLLGCCGPEVDNRFFRVQPETTPEGLNIGLGVIYTGPLPIEPTTILLIGYGAVAQSLLAPHHESTAMFLDERVCGGDDEEEEGLYLLNDGIVSKIAFVNHSCDPNCDLSTAVVSHSFQAGQDGAAAVDNLPRFTTDTSVHEPRAETAEDGLVDAFAAMRVADTRLTKARALLPAVVSKRTIMPGEYLSFNYDWDATELSAPIPCLCGAACCSGWLRRPASGKRKRER